MRHIIVSSLAALAVWTTAFYPGIATAACSKLRGYAQLCADDNTLLDSQHPDHPVVCPAGMSCAGLTASGTSTATGTGTGTYYLRHDVPLTISSTGTGSSTNTLYTVDPGYFTIGTSTVTSTSAAVADNPTYHGNTGSGTAKYLAKWSTGGLRLENSKIYDDGGVSISIGGHAHPATDDAFTLGYSGKRWYELHLSGLVTFYGATSGDVSIKAPATATSYLLTLPPDDGEGGQFLQTDGNGVASWAFATELGTATASHVFVLPNATKTVTSTETFTETDFAQTAAGASKIPMAGTNSKIDINWLPTGTSTATSVLVTGGDARLIPAVMVLPNANKTAIGTFTVNTTDIAMTTPTAGNIPLAGTNNKIDVGWLPATATPTASKIPIADASGTLNSWVTSGRMVTYASSEPTGGFTLLALGSGNTDIVTFSGTFTGRVFIQGQALVYRDAPSVVGCQLDITLDGTQIGVPGMVTAATPDGSQATRSVSTFAMATLAGAYTIKLRGNGLSGTCNINNGANQVGAYVQFFN